MSCSTARRRTTVPTTAVSPRMFSRSSVRLWGKWLGKSWGTRQESKMAKKTILVSVSSAVFALSVAGMVYAESSSTVQRTNPEVPRADTTVAPCSAAQRVLVQDTGYFSTDYQNTVGTVLNSGDSVLSDLGRDNASISEDAASLGSQILAGTAAQ